MRSINQEKFLTIVRYARETNPFYARWIPKDGPVPILTRQIVQQHNDELLNGHPEVGKTSGSTGIPVRVATGPVRGRLEREDNRRVISWLGGPLPRLEIILPTSWRSKLNLIPIQTPLPEQVVAIRKRASRHPAMSLITYPSNAVLLSQYILARKIPFPTVRRMVLMAEPLDPGQRAIIQQAFPNALIWMTYSSVELGIIAAQCPHEPDFYHIMSHKVGVEILDENGQPVPFGEVGQVVITDYFNCQMPLIRYAIGDLAAFGKCPCGKIPTPALSKVLGKVRGSLLHANGRRSPFLEFGIVFRDLPGIRQFQVIQEELHRFTVKIVADHNIDAEIHAAFLKEFGYSNQVDVIYMNDIPRDPSGKFFISICKV